LSVKRLTLVLVGIALLAAAGSLAMAQGNKFRVFVAAAYVEPLSEDDQDIDGQIDALKATSEVGWTVGFEWRVTKWFGLELDYLSVDEDLEFGGEKIASTNYNPLSLSANFHLVHTKIVDFWVAPTISYVDWGDIEVPNDDNISTDSSTAWGATLGLDLSFFKFMAVTLGLRYTKVDIEESDGGTSSSVDPLMARAGLSFHF